MQRTLWTTIVLVIGICFGIGLERSPAADSRSLAERVAELEKRVAALEQQIQPVAKKADIDEIRRQAKIAAQKRMQQDLQTHSRQQISEAERLYQQANRDLRSPDAVKILEQMIEKYPQCNRTGCAVMYLGQMSEGEQRAKYLKLAAEKFADCRYGNGVQVGAYALWYLAHDALEAKKTDEAKALLRKLMAEYPDAIDHKGNLLAERMPIEVE